MKHLPATPDPYTLITFGTNDYYNNISYRQVLNRVSRSATINTSLKTLVLLVTGQSLWSNILPSLLSPVNSSVIDNFNIFDGNLYDCNGPLLGTTYTISLGRGNVVTRIADGLITNGKFSRVIIVPMAVGSTTIAMWATGDLSNRCSVAMQRLANKGITPSVTNVTFACLMGVGEQDYINGTTQNSYATSAATFISNLQATGFNGRIFWDSESAPLQTSNAIRSAIASLWDGTTVFNGGDSDSIPLTSRQDGTHFNDVGGLQMYNISIAAMAASGTPF